jgi:hypothetical protein
MSLRLLVCSLRALRVVVMRDECGADLGRRNVDLALPRSNVKMMDGHYLGSVVSKDVGMIYLPCDTDRLWHLESVLECFPVYWSDLL